jgi:divalent metal cation (Fe/Co/Zn/Cd) transporter
LLIGESASTSDIEAIERAVREDPEVDTLIHMRTEHIGPEELLVGVKVGLHRTLDVDRVSAAINRIESRIRERVPAARLIYIEPDILGQHP